MSEKFACRNGKSIPRVERWSRKRVNLKKKPKVQLESMMWAAVSMYIYVISLNLSLSKASVNNLLKMTLKEPYSELDFL